MLNYDYQSGSIKRVYHVRVHRYEKFDIQMSSAFVDIDLALRFEIFVTLIFANIIFNKNYK